MLILTFQTSVWREAVLYTYVTVHIAGQEYTYSAVKGIMETVMNQKRLSEDLANMEEVLSRTADRCDIWQDRLIHAMARAIYDILVWILKHSNK